MLKNQREHLTELLLKLMEQRDLRAKEIARRMVSLLYVYVYANPLVSVTQNGIYVYMYIYTYMDCT